MTSFEGYEYPVTRRGDPFLRDCTGFGTELSAAWRWSPSSRYGHYDTDDDGRNDLFACGSSRDPRFPVSFFGDGGGGQIAAGSDLDGNYDHAYNANFAYDYSKHYSGAQLDAFGHYDVHEHRDQPDPFVEAGRTRKTDPAQCDNWVVVSGTGQGFETLLKGLQGIVHSRIIAIKRGVCLNELWLQMNDPIGVAEILELDGRQLDPCNLGPMEGLRGGLDGGMIRLSVRPVSAVEWRACQVPTYRREVDLFEDGDKASGGRLWRTLEKVGDWLLGHLGRAEDAEAGAEMDMS
mmetsp:Transcript_17534/g.43702  ORF Transcript_17534/g.43702 Transcript_17534/m.43702 type:complete len:291 (-) Transcript_17534:332-1204(-)|eukprot:g5693.t1